MNEAELLFTKILNCNRVDLYLNKNLQLDREKFSLVSSVLRKRISGEPIQYILGKTEFMGFEFRVAPGVFIPRPETEILVETVIKYATELARYQVTKLDILDIGTGSGCMAISLAKLLKDIEITAIDISQETLEIASQNAWLNNVKVRFLKSNLFDNDELRTMNYELILSNPPYIPTAEIESLQPEVRYQPRIALDGGRDGLDFYRRIIRESPRYLKDRGFLIMEMGFGQAKAIKNIFKISGNFKITKVIKDYNHIDRVIVVEFKG